MCCKFSSVIPYDMFNWPHSIGGFMCENWFCRRMFLEFQQNESAVRLGAKDDGRAVLYKFAHKTKHDDSAPFKHRLLHATFSLLHPC